MNIEWIKRPPAFNIDDIGIYDLVGIVGPSDCKIKPGDIGMFWFPNNNGVYLKKVYPGEERKAVAKVVAYKKAKLDHKDVINI